MCQIEKDQNVWAIEKMHVDLFKIEEKIKKIINERRENEVKLKALQDINESR